MILLNLYPVKITYGGTGGLDSECREVMSRQVICVECDLRLVKEKGLLQTYSYTKKNCLSNYKIHHNYKFYFPLSLSLFQNPIPWGRLRIYSLLVVRHIFNQGLC